jgi:hypothetical protein
MFRPVQFSLTWHTPSETVRKIAWVVFGCFSLIWNNKLVAAVEFLLDPCRSRETTLADLCRQVNEEELKAALASCRAFQHLEERGFVDEISSYYSYLRRYFPTLFELVFET